MAFASLADFLEVLAGAGELARVTVEVDPDLEIAQISAQAAKVGGPALLFERVRGRSGVVVTNLFGAVSRICRALEVETLDAFHERGAQLTEAAHKPTWLDRLKGNEPGGLERFEPKRVKQAPCQQVVKLASDVDLGQIPILRSWPEDSHPAITGGQLLTMDAATGRRSWQNVALPVVGKNRLALRLTPFDAAWSAVEDVRRQGQKLPVAVVLGGSPLAMLLGDLPLAAGVDPLALAGFWGGEPLAVVPGRSQPLDVPAAAECILEGVLDPTAPPLDAGKLVGASGYCLPLAECVTIEITAITQRTNAGFPAIVPSAPPSEATARQQLLERLLVANVRQAAPEVVDLALPSFGGRHGYLFVAMEKRFANHARKVASAIWGLESLMLTKTIVLVDAGVNVHDLEQVFRQMAHNVWPGRDYFAAEGPAAPDDRAGGGRGMAAKMGIDATSKLPSEGAADWPAAAVLDPSRLKPLQARWRELGLDFPPPG